MIFIYINFSVINVTTLVINVMGQMLMNVLLAIIITMGVFYRKVRMSV